MARENTLGGKAWQSVSWLVLREAAESGSCQEHQASNLRVGGITVISAESETLTRASEETLGLSIQDTTCLRVADERYRTCVTNERALRNEDHS